MSYEWHVEFALKLQKWDALQNQARAELTRAGGGPPTPGKVARKAEELARKQLKEMAQCADAYAGLQLLSQAMGDEDSAGQWAVQAKGAYADKLPAYEAYLHTQNDLMTHLGLATPMLKDADIAILPEHSFFLYLPFTLASPYMSKDDEPLYVHENPVRKDAVFRVPLISATGWKGALRAALRYTLDVPDDDPRIVRLCGNPKAAESGFYRGRLAFFPTFFDKIAVGVINPHSRETGAGQQPIHLEQVPPGARGALALLYSPCCDPVRAKHEVKFSARKLAWADAAAVLDAVYSMLVELGFGAKTAAGMGRAGRLPRGGYFLLPRQATRLRESVPLESLAALSELSKQLASAISTGGSHV